MDNQKKNITIPPFKRKLETDPRFAEKNWKFLEDAIHDIYNQNTSSLSFEVLFRTAYNMVFHKSGDFLYSGFVNITTQHLGEIANSVESVEGGLFLEELNRKWLEHNKSLYMIRDILMHMERNLKKPRVHVVGLNLWRDNVVRSTQIRDRLVDTLLKLVRRERKGEVINRGLMRNITTMLSDLGQGQEVYKEDFERPFLDSARDFYRVESQTSIQTSDCSEYLKNAERRLDEEMERVTHYLNPESERKIIAIVEREMIRNHMRLLVEMENSGLVSMLIHEKYDDLARMYRLFRRVKSGLQIMSDAMINYLRETGKQLVTDLERLKEPVEFVQLLLDMKDKYDNIMHSSFNSDKTFHNALDSSFEYLINLNLRSPEFISLFMDDKLRKGLGKSLKLKDVSEEEVETVLDKVMMLFRYLREKDVFEKYYKQHLARRLLSTGRAVSDDAERSLIMKLTTECGYPFTSKLEGMVTDIKTSRDTMLEFHRMLSTSEASEGPTLAVQVLTAGSWPTQFGAKCNLPTEILTVCDKFKAYYLSTHTGRRLTWQTDLGTADLKATFANGQKHEINVSTYQMCVLLLFNKTDKLSYREIEQATDIPSRDLKRTLQSLACVKGKNVLRKEPMSKDISEDDFFLFNHKFASKFYKVKISSVVAKKESELENRETREKVEENRKPQIDSAIVRVMKSRQVLEHSNLISEVTKQLQARFLPNPVVIRRRIETLIEREFLERDQIDHKRYRYIA